MLAELDASPATALISTVAAAVAEADNPRIEIVSGYQRSRRF
jgi:hypothetical protein